MGQKSVTVVGGLVQSDSLDVPDGISEDGGVGASHILYQQGLEFYKRRDFDRADQKFSSAIRMREGGAFPEAFNARGLARAAVGRTSPAVRDFGRALQLRPDYAQAHYNCGVVYRRNGDCDKAIEEYAAAIKLKRSFAEAFNNRGVAYLKVGSLAHAEADFAEALRLKPGYAKALYGQGVAREMRCKTGEAIESFTESILLDPTLRAAFLVRNEPIPLSGADAKKKEVVVVQEGERKGEANAKFDDMITRAVLSKLPAVGASLCDSAEELRTDPATWIHEEGPMTIELKEMPAGMLEPRKDVDVVVVAAEVAVEVGDGDGDSGAPSAAAEEPVKEKEAVREKDIF